MKVVINTCYGGFGLSDEAVLRLAELGIPIYAGFEAVPLQENMPDGPYCVRLSPPSFGRGFSVAFPEEHRGHPALCRVVEELGTAADGPHARLKVVDIPDGVEFSIEDYDGMERIAETHRRWR